MVNTTVDAVEFTEQGFLVRPEVWNEGMVPDLAIRAGIGPLTDRHWMVIRFARRQFLDTGSTPTVRLLGKASGVSVRELYKLFPRSPSMNAARLSGIPKLYLCHNPGLTRNQPRAKRSRLTGRG